ncbi:MAG: Crp/Fnr family transcriptional regulator [bacterium]
MADRAPSGFLGSLTAQEYRAFLRRGRRRRFRSGAMLFREGERSDGVLAVLSGRVKVSYFTDEGREIVLAVRGSGELLGELSTIDGEPRSATGTALGPVEALAVSGEAFTEFLQEFPRVSLVLLRTISRRLREATRRRIEYGSLDTTARVAARLVELADQYGEAFGSSVRILLPLTQEELAGWVGASREAVSKALRALRQRGWIETHRRGVTVLNRDALRLHAT